MDICTRVKQRLPTPRKEVCNMSIRNRILSALTALVLVLCPLAALASENTIEAAPEVTLPQEEINDAASGDPTYYTPTEQVYAYDPNEYLPTEEQYELIGSTADARLYLPRLTDRELELYDKLMADLADGKDLHLEDQGYANKTEDVLIGVYPLDPAEFDGETYYVLLPPVQMGTSHLYSLVLAFEQLGLTFDPAALNARNCTRGGYYTHPSTRYLSYEEQQRMDRILHQIHRGILEKESLKPETPCLTVGTKWSTYEPIRFRFYPYRSMTDDELAAFAFSEDTAWDIDPDALDAECRAFARSMLRLPLSMVSTDELMEAYADGGGSYRFTFQPFYVDAKTGSFAEAKLGEPMDLTVWQYLTREDDGTFRKWFTLSLYFIGSDEFSDEHPGFTEDDWIAAARKWAADSLVLPEDRMPDDWQVANMGAGEVTLIAKKAGWTYQLSLNISDVSLMTFQAYEEEEY